MIYLSRYVNMFIIFMCFNVFMFPCFYVMYILIPTTRIKQTTMGSAICNTIKSELRVECACLVAGSIRAKRHYKGEKHFTYGHLKSELPFETCVMYMELPGQVLCDSIGKQDSSSLYFFINS